MHAEPTNFTLTKEEKLMAVDTLYARAYLYFPSFEENNVGSHLFYLAGSIVQGFYFDCEPNNPILPFLKSNFVSHHVILRHIVSISISSLEDEE